jgi:hypothetical protein
MPAQHRRSSAPVTGIQSDLDYFISGRYGPAGSIAILAYFRRIPGQGHTTTSDSLQLFLFIEMPNAPSIILIGIS